MASTLLIPATFYGMGHNEMLVGRALRGRRDKVFVSVKFGGLVRPERAFVGFDTRPQLVKALVLAAEILTGQTRADQFFGH